MKKVLFAALTIMFISSCSKTDSTPEKVYTKVSVSKLTILNYPATKTTGADWDGSLQGTYPDVYFKLTKNGTSNSLYSLATSSRAENLRTIDLPYSWANSSGAPFYVLNDLTQILDVDLYDYESVSSDEYMGTATFNFSNYTTGSTKYPSTLTMTTGSTSIKLDLIWLE